MSPFSTLIKTLVAAAFALLTSVSFAAAIPANTPLSLVSVFATVTFAGVGVTTQRALGQLGSGSPVGFARFDTALTAIGLSTVAVTVTSSVPFAGTTSAVHVVV